MQGLKIGDWIRRNGFSAIGIGLALLVIAGSLLAPVLAPAAPDAQDLDTGLTLPSFKHLLGTDQLGRDILSRVMWAGRISITITAIVLLLSLILGGSMGMLAGYLGGWTDQICMRLVDLLLSVPTFILALALIGALGLGLQNLVLALAVSSFPAYARLVRSQVLAIKHREFILAAEALGGGALYVLSRHYLPAIMGAVMVQLSLNAGTVILAIAGLSFIGLGVQPPLPEWGAMLVDARPFMQVAPHLVLAPGLAILFTVFGFNALGEALESWLDPRRHNRVN
ncbi:MAG: ABC transporter permease [Pseudanabaenales cyanobacterium]|nr:ABC transporter permease [Pseudanabaenales cyanobacterium]